MVRQQATTKAMKKLLIIEDYASFLALWPRAAKIGGFDEAATAETVDGALSKLQSGDFTHMVLDGTLGSDPNACDTLPILEMALAQDIIVCAASGMHNDKLVANGAQFVCEKGQVFEQLSSGHLFSSQNAAADTSAAA